MQRSIVVNLMRKAHTIDYVCGAHDVVVYGWGLFVSLERLLWNDGGVLRIEDRCLWVVPRVTIQGNHKPRDGPLRIATLLAADCSNNYKCALRLQWVVLVSSVPPWRHQELQ